MSLTPVWDLLAARRLRKVRAILADDTHPQHGVVVNAVETAIALDPPDGYTTNYLDPA